MFKLFKNFTKKDLFYIFICVGLVVFQVWLDLKIPDYMSSVTKLIQSNSSTIGDILREGGYMLLCALGSLVAAVIVGYFATILASKFSKDLRKKIFDKTLKLGMAEIKKFSTSSLLTRTTNDVNQVEMLIAMGLQMLVRAPIMAVWAVTKILNKNLNWSILTGTGVVILLVTIGILMAIVLPRFKIVQKLIDKINGVTRENLTGIRVIRAFNAENFQRNRFEEVNEKLTHTQLFNQRCFSILNPIMNIVMHILTLGIYFIGAFMIEEAGMVTKITLFSDMVVFSSYGMQVIMSFLMLALIFMIWPRASVSANRINEVLDEKLSLIEGTVNQETEVNGLIEFKNVSFKYPGADEYVLKNISFKAEKGETVAFIGSTGSGKSTLINLVPRFYDVTEGEVLIDGINVKDYTFKALNDKIGYVPQKAVMFTGSVIDNIAYGKIKNDKVSKTDVLESANIAQAKEFIEKMDRGFDSHIARGGTNVSGGQKQRIAIARALARKPEILIFDDSFSALDYKTDYNLRKNLKKYIKDSTNLIVAQRIGTIINADKIIVLEKGECVGIGTHKQLLKSCDIYREIALSQVTKEELENA